MHTLFLNFYCMVFVVESRSMLTFRLSSAFDAVSDAASASALAATIFALTLRFGLFQYA